MVKKIKTEGIIEKSKAFVSVVPFLNIFWLKKGTMEMKFWV